MSTLSGKIVIKITQSEVNSLLSLDLLPNIVKQPLFKFSYFIYIHIYQSKFWELIKIEERYLELFLRQLRQFSMYLELKSQDFQILEDVIFKTTQIGQTLIIS